TPHHHLQKSIAYHFAEELKEFEDTTLSLRRLRTQELKAASIALLLLKKSGVVDPKLYHLVLGKDNKGEALRLFLPQLANMAEDTQKSLMNVLYAGVVHGIQTQGNKLLTIKDPAQLVLATALRERFMCATQMQAV